MSTKPTKLITYENVSVFAVDDEPEYLETFRIAARYFDRLSCFTMDRPDGVVDWALSKPLSRFSLFFLDIRFHSRRLGFEICRSIRKDDVFRFSPVIFMSTSLDQNDINEAFRSGANSYFHKSTGTSKRIKAAHDQLSYWLDKANLSENGVSKPDSKIADRLASNLGPSSGRRPSIDRPVQTMERLQSDLLSSLLRDLGNQSGDVIPQSTKDTLLKSIRRLREIFSFTPEAFLKQMIDCVDVYCNCIEEWVKLASLKHEGFRIRQDQCLEEASSARKALGLWVRRWRNQRALDLGGHFFRIDVWIWDTFGELSANPSFPSLYLSLKRFRALTFHSDLY